jgi:hypothetical protein
MWPCGKTRLNFDRVTWLSTSQIYKFDQPTVVADNKNNDNTPKMLAAIAGLAK